MMGIGERWGVLKVLFVGRACDMIFRRSSVGRFGKSVKVSNLKFSVSARDGADCNWRFVRSEKSESIVAVPC